MQTFLIILIVLVSVLLAFIVLIQNPKGGGLSSGFAGSSNLMGVQRTGDFLEKGTWGLVITLMVLCIAFNILGPSAGSGRSGGLGDQIEAPVQQAPLNLNNPAQQQAPVKAPAAAPADSTK
ncbi:preprotein translocase subunit SecG [Sphingobacterium psychroaquaticum]|uniref:Protein-export membrane protein SecG n=1 Tax=Sphingobacterium psychroaquaticum TaxID=561061 RepID=A0A1X7K767_9SPHI|nr:preprotein translocase subunit SecG [Sphingobacterium psychroaquaticum]QBQ42646.1 preprotein translocase subunit SecG [Sphingobacterium psychroaquaticum]SMG36125.1 preprotein translocase subunit SecG [Sphingobacterium psychroaquaticum]